MMDTVELALCEDCALVWGAGYTDEDLGQSTYGAAGLPWDEYVERVEGDAGNDEILRTLTLADVEGMEVGIFDCTLCEAPNYGRLYRATATVRA